MGQCKHHYVYLYTEEINSYLLRYWKYGQYETTTRLLLPGMLMAFYGCTKCNSVLVTDKWEIM